MAFPTHATSGASDLVDVEQRRVFEQFLLLRSPGNLSIRSEAAFPEWRLEALAMQWGFLVLALCAAVAELNSGTFYLAGVALAALLTVVAGFWIRGDLLIFAFVGLCTIFVAAVSLFRRRTHSGGLADFDIGQRVTVRGPSPHGDHLTVSYRGSNWEAVMEDGSVPLPGAAAVIVRRTDKLLHLAMPPKSRP
jgi:membrane protein implicated in regulation of membrane protease activity